MPIRPVDFVRQPYVPDRRTLGQLLGLQAQTSGQMWSDLGNTIAGGLRQYAQERQQAPIRAQEQRIRDLQEQAAVAEADARKGITAQEEALQRMLATTPNPTLKDFVPIYGGGAPAKYEAWFKATQAPITAKAEADERTVKGLKDRRDAVSGQLNDTPIGAPIPSTQFAEAVSAGVPTGRFEYGSPGDVPLMRNGQPETAMPPMVTNAGTPEQIVAQQREAREAKPKPSSPPNVGSFEDYVVRRFGQSPTPAQIAQARKDYNQSDDRPLPPIVITTGTGPQLVDRNTGTATHVTDAGGTAIPMAPTAQQRNMDAAKGSITPILDSVYELSEKINTQQGVIAKIAGAEARAKAKLNLDDDVAEYQAMVAAFTPLWARALGHVGVLTQQDVDSAREALPKPGDSRSLRDRKLARIQKIMGGPAPSGTPRSDTAPATMPSADDLKGLRPGSGRKFRDGPFSGQTWTIDAAGNAVRVP